MIILKPSSHEKSEIKLSGLSGNDLKFEKPGWWWAVNSYVGYLTFA
jgi:hypothetical protein